MTMVPSPSDPKAIGSFDFHGDTVTVVADERGSWAVLGQLCRNLGLDAEGQRQAVERKSWSRGKTCVMQVMLPGQDRAYPLFVIHERIVPMWLANITSSRISARDKRAKIEEAQVELADALYAYVISRTAPTPPREMSKLEALRAAIESEEARLVAEERAAVAERQVAELEPAARSWEVLASAAGDFALRDAALILNRDPNILTGQNLLKRSLADLRMTDRWGTPYAAHKTHLTERPRTYTDKESGEERQAKPQIRVTVAGLKYLHRKLGGVAPLQFDQPPLDEAG